MRLKSEFKIPSFLQEFVDTPESRTESQVIEDLIMKYSPKLDAFLGENNDSSNTKRK